MGKFNITKGDRFKIAKTEGLNNVRVILSWKSGDLDVSAFLCGDEGVILDDTGFVFYNSEHREKPYDRESYGNKKRWRSETRPMSGDGAVLGALDDREGKNGEILNVNLDKVDCKISEIIFAATSHECTFGDVTNASIAIFNEDTDEVLCRYDLDEEFTTETAVSVAKLVINEDGDWSFEAMGLGYDGGIETLIDIYAS